MTGQRILIVDDDASIRDALGDYLSDHGFSVASADGASALDALLAKEPADLIVLDLMMPGEDGLSICRRLHGTGTPILMLSAMGTTTDRIVGLELGASDYLAKPFEPRELLARIRALLRRLERSDDPARVLRFAGWQLDTDARRLTDPSGRPVSLTRADFLLLRAFAERPGRLLSRDLLLEMTRDETSTPFDRAIDLAVSRLRRRLAPRGEVLIETVRGEGYRFTATVTGL